MKRRTKIEVTLITTTGTRGTSKGEEMTDKSINRAPIVTNPLIGARPKLKGTEVRTANVVVNELVNFQTAV